MAFVLTITGNRARLNSGPTATLMAALARIEGRRRWLEGAALDVEATEHNISVLTAALPGLQVEKITASSTEFLGAGAGEASARAEAFAPKTPHLQHQKIGLAKALTKPHFALFMEQGTGKTKVAIDLSCIRRIDNQVTGVLVIALSMGIARQWINNQLPTHCSITWRGILWEPGKIKSVLKRVERKGNQELDFFCMNIDAIKTKAGMNAALAFINAHKGKVMIVIDESQSIKNVSSERWKAAFEIGRHATHKMILTGTPVARNLQDEWAQLKWLHEDILGIRYISAFRNEYCIMGGYEGREIVSHKNIERFRQKVDPWTYRVTAEDVGVMPLIRERWRFDLTDRQREMIKSLKDNWLAQISETQQVETDNPAIVFMRCQQIASGFATTPEGQIVSLFNSHEDNPRVQALLDVMETRPGKVIVWCRFREDIRILKEVLGDKAVAYAKETPAKMEQAVKSFLAEGGPTVFLSTAALGGTGLNLQGSLTTVFYSNSDNSIDRWQAEFRNNRLGTVGQVTAIDLVAKGSPDARILANHQNKKMISQMALDEVIQAFKEEW